MSNNWGLTSWFFKKSFIIVICEHHVYVGGACHSPCTEVREQLFEVSSLCLLSHRLWRLSCGLHMDTASVFTHWSILWAPKFHLLWSFRSLGSCQSLRIQRVKLPGGECNYHTPIMVTSADQDGALSCCPSTISACLSVTRLPAMTIMD